MTSSVIRKSERTIPGLVYMILKTVWPYIVHNKSTGQIRMSWFFVKKTNKLKINLKINSKISIVFPTLKSVFFSKLFVFIVKITQSYRSGAIFMNNYPFILEFSLKFDFKNISPSRTRDSFVTYGYISNQNFILNSMLKKFSAFAHANFLKLEFL